MTTATTKEPGDFEPLLIPTLRMLIALPLVMSVIPLTLHWLRPAWFEALPWMPDHVQTIPLVFVVLEALALLLLYLPGVQRWLGKRLLPIVLCLMTLGLLGGMTVQLLVLRVAAEQVADQLTDIPFVYSFWPPAFFALIPMVVVAWQYSFRHVVLFALALVAAELLIVGLLFWNAPSGTLMSLVQVALFRTIIFLLTGYLVSRLVASQRMQRAELVRANTQLAAYALTREKLAVSHERNRLARDLHDTLAHYLSGLVLELEGTRLLWRTDPSQAQLNLDESIATARSGLMETRRALQALRAAPLDDLGLAGAIRELARNSAERNQWELDLALPDTSLTLPPATEGALYRIVQEAMTNIERHAQARHVSVDLAGHGSDVVLQITDDGIGYHPEEVAQGGHFGISGMIERAAMMGGTLQIDTPAAGGTRITATIPQRRARSTNAAAATEEQATEEQATEEQA